MAGIDEHEESNPPQCGSDAPSGARNQAVPAPSACDAPSLPRRAPNEGSNLGALTDALELYDQMLRLGRERNAEASADLYDRVLPRLQAHPAADEPAAEPAPVSAIRKTS